jgi:hypothetical protein
VYLSSGDPVWVGYTAFERLEREDRAMRQGRGFWARIKNRAAGTRFC